MSRILKNKFASILIIIGIIFISLGSALTIFNIFDEIRVYNISNKALNYELSEKEKNEIYTDGDMPYIKVNGIEYIGVLEIPSISIRLPVQNRWDNSLLKKFPCRYIGDIYSDSMIIMAHNYKQHFGNIKYLKNGDKVRFTDVKGIEYDYIVSFVEKIDRRNINKMVEDKSKLTLFTCDYSGKNRIAVRCEIMK